MTTHPSTPGTSLPLVGRRPVVCSAAALCVLAVGACIRYGKGKATPPGAPAASAAPAGIATPTAAGTATAGGTATGAGTATATATAATGAGIAKLADIAVGGGAVLADRQLVVTRPKADEIHVLSAVCTHQGCLVDTVANGTISCPCHGSAYSLTGDVTSGPATRPLASQQFSVVDGVVRV
jgi:Rieske Fe-S protein